MNDRHRRAVLAAMLRVGALALVLGPGRPAAATPVYRIHGHVTDSYNGEPVQDCFVTATAGSWDYHEDQTDEDGYYEILGLGPEVYDVGAWIYCYSGSPVDDVDLTNGGDITLDFVLDRQDDDVEIEILSPEDDEAVTGTVPLIVKVREIEYCKLLSKMRTLCQQPGYMAVYQTVDVDNLLQWPNYIQQWYDGIYRYTIFKAGDIDTRQFRNGPMNADECIEYWSNWGGSQETCPPWDDPPQCDTAWWAPECQPCTQWYCNSSPPDDDGEGGGESSANDSTAPVVKNLTIENVAVSSGSVDYLVFDPASELPVRQHPTIAFDICDGVAPGEETPEYVWTVLIRDTDVPNWTLDGGAVLTGTATYSANLRITATIDDELTAAGTYAFDIHVVQTGEEGGEADAYWFKQPYDLRIPAAMPGGGPGHDAWAEYDESGNIRIMYSYYLQDPTGADATRFRVDLLNPSLNVIATGHGGAGGVRTNIPHREHLLTTIDPVDWTPGTWRVVFCAEDKHGADGYPPLHRNAENKVMLAVNGRLRVPEPVREPPFRRPAAAGPRFGRGGR